MALRIGHLLVPVKNDRLQPTQQRVRFVRINSWFYVQNQRRLDLDFDPAALARLDQHGRGAGGGVGMDEADALGLQAAGAQRRDKLGAARRREDEGRAATVARMARSRRPSKSSSRAAVLLRARRRPASLGLSRPLERARKGGLARHQVEAASSVRVRTSGGFANRRNGACTMPRSLNAALRAISAASAG